MNFDNSKFPRKFNNNNFQWRLTPNTEKEIVFKNNEKIQLTPINLEIKTLENFDLETFTKMCESDDADIEKIKAYLEKCGIEYEISDDGKTISVKNAVVNNCKIPKMDFQIREASETNTTENKTDIKTLVNQYVETWVNDFKTGYKRWGLESAPTEAQIKTFKETLTKACADTTSLKDTTEEGVKVWVRAQANVAITQVKFDSYSEGLAELFAKSFADFGLDSALTADELKQVKDAFEKAYKAGLNTHVASINAKGDHQIESNSDLQTWFKSLLTEALKPVKISRGVKAGEVPGGQLQQWHLLGSPYFEQTDNGTFKLKSGFYIGTEEIKTVQQLLDALQNKKTITTKPVNESPTTPTTSSTTTTDNKIDYSFLEKIITNAATRLPDSVRDTNAFNPTIAAYYTDGNVVGENSIGDNIYNDLLNQIRNDILTFKGDDYLENTIGEVNFAALFKAAWVSIVESTASSNVNGRDFAKNVLAKLQEMLKHLQQHPENLELLTNTSVDTTGLADYNTTTKINCKNYKQYDSKEYHLDDNNSDKTFQNTMQQLLDRIYAKYPSVDKDVLKDLFYQAQGQALSAINGQGIVAMTHYGISGSNNAEMESIVDVVMYKFHNLLAEKVLKDGNLKTRTTEANATPAVESSQSEEQNNNIKEGAAGVKDGVLDVADDIVANCSYKINNKRTIHTEFGINKDGKIVFQEQDTTTVYDTILTKLKSKLERSTYKDALAKLGGEEVLEKLLQSAWITTYNDFNSSTSNDLNEFVDKVMNNLEKMLDKLQTNPELMETFTKRTSYADSTLTKDLKNYNTATTYGNDEKISYAGEVTTYEDGTVHISNINDDNDYQTTMNALLVKVISKYPEIDKQTITNVFRNAQREAIKALQQNLYDCPYGTGNNSSRVEDTDDKRNWGGKDNRTKDKSYIDMDQLVQMTLYYFDKLLMQELTK